MKNYSNFLHKHKVNQLKDVVNALRQELENSQFILVNKLQAMRAAIFMIKDLNAGNKIRLSEGKLTVNIGISLNTDRVVSSNIGSKKLINHTIIGDGVNATCIDL